MWFGKTEIAAQRAASADAYVGNFGFHLSQYRQVFLDNRRTLDGAMGRGAADHEGAVFQLDLVQIRDCLRLMNRETSKGHHKLKLFQLFKHSKRSNRHKA